MRAIALDYVAPAFAPTPGNGVVLIEGYEVAQSELAAAVKDADVVIMRSRLKLDSAAIDAARQLKLVVRAGSGTDNIDVAALDARGITLRTVSGTSARSVAEMGLAAILALTRHLWRANATLRSGMWAKESLMGRELGELTVLLIGYGQIGRALGKLLIACGSNVIVYSRSGAGDDGLRSYANLHEALAECDVASLQLPLTAASRHIINADVLRYATRQPFLVNLSRWDVMDMEAVGAALRLGQLGGVFIDPVDDPKALAPFFDLPLYAAPHLGAQTLVARQRVGDQVNAIIEDFIAKGTKI